MIPANDRIPAPTHRLVGHGPLSAREYEIAKIAWKQGYGNGHNHTVEGHYAPPDEYDYDILQENIDEGLFDDIHKVDQIETRMDAWKRRAYEDFIIRLRFMCDGDESIDLRNIAAWIDRDFPTAKNHIATLAGATNATDHRGDAAKDTK